MTDAGEYPRQAWPPLVTINLNIHELDSEEGVISFALCMTEGGDGCDLDALAYVVVNPEYIDGAGGGFYIDYDFALIFLPEAVPIEPVRLNDDPAVPSDGADVEIMGWGRTDPEVWDSIPNTPRIATVQYMPNEECALIYGDNINPRQLCTNADGKSSCNGDSGQCIYVLFIPFLRRPIVLSE